MGEHKFKRDGVLPIRELRPGQQIQVDLRNAVQKECGCGSKYFIPVVTVFGISALVSPNGQDLTVQQPVLICMDCKALLKQ